ncbi:MAG: hypothetical protein ACR2GH_18840 [Pseudonocardia sp.]
MVHHRWVLTKFVITLAQLYLGIFVLSGTLDRTADSAAGSPVLLVVGAGAMASALGFQAWLSIAKPGRRTRWATDLSSGTAVRLPTARPWVFVAGVGAPVLDITLGLLLEYPMPVTSGALLVATVVARRRALRNRTDPTGSDGIRAGRAVAPGAAAG